MATRSWRQFLSRSVYIWLAIWLALFQAVNIHPASAQGSGVVSAPLAESGSGVPQGLKADEWASLREQMAAAEYQVTWQVQEGRWAYRAPNRAQGFGLAFARQGLRATGAANQGQAGWSFELAARAYGNQALPVSPQELSADGARITYRWNAALSEWYRNTPEGVEHGLTLSTPPETGPLAVTFALSGSLTPQIEAGGQALRLVDKWGKSILRYDQLKVYDASGRLLPAHLALQGGFLRLEIQVGGAVYPITVDPRLHTESKILHASDAQADDTFGVSVVVSGDTLVVGARLEDGGAGGTLLQAGAAYIFTRNRGGVDNWGQAKILRASDAEAHDNFGHKVAISGDILVVGALGEGGGVGSLHPNSGAAYVFYRNRGGADYWGENSILHASDAQTGDLFGAFLDISGDTLVVGAWSEDGVGGALPNSGAAYIFTRNSGGADNWGEDKILHASDTQAEDYFGFPVFISGDTVVVGASGEDGGGGDLKPDAGAAYIFSRNRGGADNWGDVKILHASDAQASDSFGYSVAISGDTLVIGASGEDGGGGDLKPDAGAAYVFTRNSGGSNNWGQARLLRASDTQAGDNFGFSVAISGDTLAIGATNEDGGAGDALSDAGAAYVFTRNRGGADNWGQVEILRASDAQAGDLFGYSAAISGDFLVVGALNEDGGAGNPQSNAGAAYLFVQQAGVWLQLDNLHASEAQADDNFGGDVAISGDTLVVGAPAEDGGAANLLNAAGAAYVFTRNSGGADNWGQVTTLRASDAQADDSFGSSVAISGDTLVVGAPYEGGGAEDALTNAGAAYVFTRNSGGADNWGEVQILHASDLGVGDQFGFSVAISGDTLVVGAWHEDGGVGNLQPDSGAAYVFTRNRGGADHWGEVTILRASDAQGGDLFGSSVTISGDTLAVGASAEDGGAGDLLLVSGAAYVFARNHGSINNWGEVTILHASDAQTVDRFGFSVAISGDTLVVGADGEDGGAGDLQPDAGAVYVFTRNNGGSSNWGEMKILQASDFQANDRFGFSVAISGDTLVVGAFMEAGAGAAYVFTRNRGGADNWGQVQILHASDLQVGDNFGFSVGISGDTLVVGAYNEDGGAGDPQSNAGAAYIFHEDLLNLFFPLLRR